MENFSSSHTFSLTPIYETKIEPNLRLWQEKEPHKNALRRLVNNNRRLTVARKPCKGCCIRKDIKEG